MFLFDFLFPKADPAPPSTPTPMGAMGTKTNLAFKIQPLESQINTAAEWIEPPVDFDELAKLYNLNALHRSCLILKAQAIVNGYRPHQANGDYRDKPGSNASRSAWIEYARSVRSFERVLSRENLYSFVLDYLIFGNAALEKLFFKGGGRRVAALAYRNMRTIRVGTKKGVCYEVIDNEKKTRLNDRLLLIKMPTTETDYYGLPEYLPAYDDIHLLNSAKNLRRRFYEHNGYLGGIFAMNVPINDVDAKTGQSKTEQAWASQILQSVTEGKKIWLLNLRGNQEIDDIKKTMSFFSLAQALRDDDFAKTAEVCSQSILNAHKVDPDLMGTERGAGGVANLEKVLKNFSDTQIDFHQDKIMSLINAVFEPENWIAFDRFYQPEKMNQ